MKSTDAYNASSIWVGEYITSCVTTSSNKSRRSFIFHPFFLFRYFTVDSQCLVAPSSCFAFCPDGTTQNRRRDETSSWHFIYFSLKVSRMYNTHHFFFKATTNTLCLSLFCFHTLQRKKKKFCESCHFIEQLISSMPNGSYAFLRSFSFTFSPTSGIEFKTIVGSVLYSLDSLVITRLCKRYTVLRDSLTPTILNVSIISSTSRPAPGRRNSSLLLCPYPGYSNFMCSSLSNDF